MKPGCVSDGLGGMSFDDVLDDTARMGVSGIGVNTCGRSTAPHFDIEGMLRGFLRRPGVQARRFDGSVPREREAETRPARGRGRGPGPASRHAISDTGTSRRSRKDV